MLFCVNVSRVLSPERTFPRCVWELSVKVAFLTHTVLSLCTFHCGPVRSLPSGAGDEHTYILISTNTNTYPLTYQSTLLLTNTDL